MQGLGRAKKARIEVRGVEAHLFEHALPLGLGILPLWPWAQTALPIITAAIPKRTTAAAL